MLIKRWFNFHSGAREEFTAESNEDVESLGRMVCYRDRPFQFMMFDKGGLIHEAHYGEISQYKFTKYFNGVYDEVFDTEDMEEVPCTCGAASVGSYNHTNYCDITDALAFPTDDEGDTLW